MKVFQSFCQSSFGCIVTRSLAIGFSLSTFSGCVPPPNGGGYYPNDSYGSSYGSSYDPYPSRYDDDDYYRRREYERDRREEERRDHERHEIRRERDRLEHEREEADRRREREREEQRRREHEREEQRRNVPPCDAGWSVRSNGCSKDERKHGCQDKRGPNNDTCVRFR